jgi:hypothetical protein
VLAEQYGPTLEGDGFRVAFADGHFTLALRDFTLPLAPHTTQPPLRRAAELLTPAPPELEAS